MEAEIIDVCSKKDITVTVQVFTYNHAPYIKKTLDSIINQKINFKIQILVLDDASTDGTSEIVREYAKKYPDLVTAIIQKENRYQKNVSIAEFVVPYTYGQYVAFCEGDDYWTTDHKLQKQLDFMKTHPNIAGTGGVTTYFTDDGIECMKPAPPQKFRGKILTKRDLVREKRFGVSTNTLMIKACMLQNERYIQAREISPKVGDGIIVPYMFEYGDVYIFDQVFQYHRIQTRADASNYNTLFTTREKYEDLVRVFNAWGICDITHKYTIRAFVRHAGFYFVLLAKEHDYNFFTKTNRDLMPQYRRYTLMAVFYGIFAVFPKFLVQKIWRFMKR